MQHKHDPRQGLPRPSPYVVARMQPQIGDTVIYAGQGYQVASILDMAQPLYADWPPGLHYVLRRTNWAKTLFLVIPSGHIQQPQDIVA